MLISELVINNRSYRRFKQNIPVKRKSLEQLVDLARMSPSGQNLQPLKYFLSNDPETNDLIFDCISWAGYLKDWDGPDAGERPGAYICILGDKSISSSFKFDSGIAAQSIMLGITEMGLGSCVIGSIKRKELAKAIDLSDQFEIILIIAIGIPKETVVIETSKEIDDIKYWRNEEGVHHVPKRTLEKIIVN